VKLSKEYEQLVLEKELKEREEARTKLEIYKNDPVEFIKNECWVFNEYKNPSIIRFSLYDYQEEFIRKVKKAYDEGRHLLNEKSRQMGFSWMYMAFFLWGVLFDATFSALVLSYKEDLVDDGGENSSIHSLFGRFRFMYEKLDERLGFKRTLGIKSLLVKNWNTDCYIVGTSTTVESGRGGTYKIVLWDEAALTPKSESILAAIQPAAHSLHLNSTVRGKANAFARLRWSADFQKEGEVVTSHWTRHPERAQGLQLVKGKWTSEWYEKQKHLLGPTQVAQEIDINYTQSIEGKIYFTFSIEHHASKELGYEDEWETILAWDLGLGDENAIVVLSRDFNKRLGVVDSYFLNEQPIRFYIDMIHGKEPEELQELSPDVRDKTFRFMERALKRDYKRKTQVLGPDVLARDMKTKRSVKDDMRNAHLLGRGYVPLHVEVMAVKVIQRIAVVSKVIDPVMDLFYVDKDQLEFIERIMGYRRKVDADGNFTQDPVHDWASHAADALGIGVCYFMKAGRIVLQKPKGL
jgi:hypothetical protein